MTTMARPISSGTSDTGEHEAAAGEGRGGGKREQRRRRQHDGDHHRQGEEPGIVVDVSGHAERRHAGIVHQPDAGTEYEAREAEPDSIAGKSALSM